MFLSLQGVFGMIVFSCILSVAVAMSILYILVLKTIISRHRQVEPSDLTAARGATTAQAPDLHHHAPKTKSCNRKHSESLFRCTAAAFALNLNQIPDHKHGLQCFEVITRRKCNVDKAISNVTHVTSFNDDRKGMAQPTEKKKLEDQVHRKSALDSEDASNRPSAATHRKMINVKTFSPENDASRTEHSFKKIKKFATEINANVTTAQFDPPVKNRESGSLGNISSVSNSDVEMTWRSQRVLSEQRNQQQVNMSFT